MTQLYSLQFVSFLVLALIVYFMVGRTRLRSCQWVVLLVASLGFYLFSGWQNLFFIGVTALSVWLVGLRFVPLTGSRANSRGMPPTVQKNGRSSVASNNASGCFSCSSWCSTSAS